MTEIINVVGIGPGSSDMMTPEAGKALESADVIAGYSGYIPLLDESFQEKKIIKTPMRGEIERCKACIREANSGKNVALICSGDPGVYGMASLLLELLGEASDVTVNIISGITAANSSAAMLGAPLANDYCVISLSDLLTPVDVIKSRIRAACEGDFVIAFYNPISKKRKQPFRNACEIIGSYRSLELPCGYVKNTGRKDFKSRVCTFGDLCESEDDIDMNTTVFVGNSTTKIINGRLVTPRGYVL